jgi:Lrp/AsnC family transcriptional regulator, leucine-responsive regulatory protein
MRNPIVAFLFVRLDPGTDAPDIARLLGEIPEALEVHRVAGEDSYLVKIRAANSEQLGLLSSRIETIDGIASARTTVVLRTLKPKQHAPANKLTLVARA